jgi:hypothetical protein
MRLKYIMVLRAGLLDTVWFVRRRSYALGPMRLSSVRLPGGRRREGFGQRGDRLWGGRGVPVSARNGAWPVAFRGKMNESEYEGFWE